MNENTPLIRLIYTYFRNRQHLSIEAAGILESIIAQAEVDDIDIFNGRTGAFEPNKLEEVSELIQIQPDAKQILEKELYSITKNYAEWKLGFSLGDMSIHEKNYQELKQENEAFEKIYGTDAYVSIKPDLLHKVILGKFPIAEFNFLCAIKTVIGNRNYGKAYRKQIVQRACGAKREEVFNSYCMDSVKEFHKQISKRYQSDKVFDSLSRKKLMCKFSPDKRGYFITTSLSLKEMSKLIPQNKKKYNAQKSEERHYNEITSKALKEAG